MCVIIKKFSVELWMCLLKIECVVTLILKNKSTLVRLFLYLGFLHLPYTYLLHRDQGKTGLGRSWFVYSSLLVGRV